LNCKFVIDNFRYIPGVMKIKTMKIYAFAPGKDKLQSLVVNHDLNMEISYLD